MQTCQNKLKDTNDKSYDKNYNERNIYNQQIIEYLSLVDVEMEHPDWPSDKKIEVSMSKSNIERTIHRQLTVDLRDKYYKENKQNYTIEQCFDYAKYIMNNVPKELIQNINEWIEDRPLSDIKVRNISVNDVMNQYGKKQKVTFFAALEAFIAWKNVNYCGKDFCYWYFFEVKY